MWKVSLYSDRCYKTLLLFSGLQLKPALINIFHNVSNDSV